MQIFLNYQGVRYKNENNFKKARTFFERAKDLGKYPYSFGMVCYHLGIAYDRSSRIVEAIDIQKTALACFIEEGNHKRQLYTKTHIANTYTQYGNYEQADLWYKQLLNNCDNNEIYERIKRNLIWNNIKRKAYSEALELLLNRQESNLTSLSYYLLILCFYKLHDYKSAMSWIHKGKEESIHDLITYSKIDTIEKLIIYDDNPNLIIQHLEETYRQLNPCLDIEGKQFYLQLLIDIYEKQNRLDKAFYYQKQL